VKIKQSHRINIGGAYIVLILTVFALTIFAILSIRTSYHELKLTEKSRDSVVKYYAADSKAEELLAIISDTIYNVQSDNIKSNENYKKELQKIKEVTLVNLQKGIVNYEVQATDVSSIQVELLLDDAINNTHFNIQSWKLVPIQQTGYDEENIDSWNGLFSN
jgi:hypothetical protein